MIPQVRIELTQQAEEMVRKARALPAATTRAIARAMDQQNQLTVGHIVDSYLSFPKQGPSVYYGLRVQSGLGRRSLWASKPTVEGNVIESGIGSNVKYMGVHEFGYTGPQSVRGFTRKVRSRNVIGRVGERAPRRIIAAGVAFVKPFTRQANFQARGFVRAGIADRATAYSDAISTAVITTWKQ